MSGKPKNFSEAIDSLAEDHDVPSQFKKLEEMLASLRPQVEELGDKVGQEARKAKRKVEENPWAAIGIVGLVFFILGFLFASKRRD